MTARLILLLSISLPFFFGCNSGAKNKKETADTLHSKLQDKRKPFFVYDAIDFYSIYITPPAVEELYDKQSNSALDSLKMGVILGDIPRSMDDLGFLDHLEHIGYKKRAIDKAEFGSIDDIFVEKNPLEFYTTACIYVYRDILIFKRDNKVVGTVKICFECNDHQINGATGNVEYFGQNGDYKKLEKLLKK